MDSRGNDSHAARRIKTLVRPALIIHADFKALLLESLLDAFDPSLLGDDRYRILEFANTSITQLTWLKPGWRIDSYQRDSAYHARPRADEAL